MMRVEVEIEIGQTI